MLGQSRGNARKNSVAALIQALFFQEHGSVSVQ